MEIRIIVVYGTKVIADRSVNAQFFLWFSGQRLFTGFAGFDFPSREFPFVFKFPISSLCSEYKIIFFNYCCDYFDCFLIGSNYTDYCLKYMY